MSIYSDCSAAISNLAARPEVFSEIDVVNLASSDGWSKVNFKEARKYANQIVSQKYRSGDLVRYGPVVYGEVQDYARRAAMIVYGGATTGPDEWDTPNGKIPRLLRHDDHIQIAGRRKGTARHDEQLWSEQAGIDPGIQIVRAPKGRARRAPKDSNELQKEIMRLTQELSQARGRVAELESGLTTSSDHGDNGGSSHTGLSKTEVEDMLIELVSGYDRRLEEIEARVDRFTKAFAAS